MTDKERRELLSRANKARAKAYSPYSGVTVGAALLTVDGKIYEGANIENAAYSPSLCAERVAFSRAIFEGERSFSAIAVAGGRRAHAAEKDFSPCGVCRQMMAEFSGGELEIILTGEDGGISVHKLSELLPLGFGKEFL